MFMFISSTATVVLKFYIQNLCILATNIISAESVCFYGQWLVIFASYCRQLSEYSKTRKKD